MVEKWQAAPAWYRRKRFDCPTCGARLVVDEGQVRRRETVSCADCNTDLALAPKDSVEAPLRRSLSRPPRDARQVRL
jgi:hypothetical protein